MSSALEIFDYVQTAGICVCLVLTFPPVVFVYFKLLFFPPFSENYTFKLIVLNGVAEILSCVGYLFVYQLISYPFMAGFYTTLVDSKLANPVTTVWSFLAGLSVNTALFVALNRLKTIVFIRQQNNDAIFCLISVVISIVLSLPSVLDLCFFTTVTYVPIDYDNSTIMIPKNRISNDILRTVSDIIRLVISLATLVVNIILSVLITKERQFLNPSEQKRFNGEKGLVITSIVSYAFYMLYFVNSVLARYLDILICGFVQWLFLGLNAITPFWCLLLFTPSVRRFVLKCGGETSVTSIPFQTSSSQSNPFASRER